MNKFTAAEKGDILIFKAHDHDTYQAKYLGDGIWSLGRNHNMPNPNVTFLAKVKCDKFAQPCHIFNAYLLRQRVCATGGTIRSDKR